MKSLTVTFMMLFVLFNSNVFAKYSLPQNQNKTGGAGLSVTSTRLNNEVIKTSLPGIWQRCQVSKDSAGVYRIKTIPLLKFISTDNTIMNIKIGSGNMSSVVISQGKYQHPSDSIYIEYLEQDMPLQAGEDNKIHVKFLLDNLMELDFSFPKYTAKEYWIRVADFKPHL